MKSLAIEAANLSKNYGVHKALDNLNMKVPTGSICGFLGRNGAGKTTTIKMMVGLSKPTCGSIYLSGKERKHGSNNNSRIGYLPDVPNFYGYMTAQEYLEFCGKLYDIENKNLKGKVGELLKQVGLNDVKSRISAYSRGMKQRLGIAQALINKPDIIFMDEPISALDPVGRHEIMTLIRSLRGLATIFFSTHILADVENTCDYALILEKGKVLLDDSIVNLRKKYAPNTALIRFYTQADGNKFLPFLQKYNELSVKMTSPTELLLRIDDMQALGKLIPTLLVEANVSLESFQTYTPSLEDIFLEVTANE